MTPHAFTLAGYADLVDALMQRGYRAVGYAEAEPDALHLVLRHDVDFDLDAALGMAEVEHVKGWPATYFVLLRTELYNPFSAGAAKALGRLRRLGHEIGLHFDAALSEAEGRDLVRAVERECAVLEGLLGESVRTFSLHRPARSLLDRPLEVPGRTNAYGARHFRDMGYCSDSRGAWHHGHPLEHEAVAAGRALQLLTHPVWWCADASEGARDKLDRFALRRLETLRAEIAANCDVYRDEPLPARSRGRAP